MTHVGVAIQFHDAVTHALTCLWVDYAKDEQALARQCVLWLPDILKLLLESYHEDVSDHLRGAGEQFPAWEV